MWSLYESNTHVRRLRHRERQRRAAEQFGPEPLMDDTSNDSHDSGRNSSRGGTGLDRRARSRRAPDDDRQRRPLGAPIVRAPIDSKLTEPNPAAPLNLLDHTELRPLPNEVGKQDGRRSRAYPEQTPVEGKPVHQLTVVDGFDLDREDEEEAARSLSPSTLTALGDFAAAMAGPIAGAIYVRSLAVFVASALLVLLVRAQGRRSALSETEISGLSPVVAGIGVLAMTFTVDASSTAGRAAIAGLIALSAGALAALAMKLVADRFVHVRVAVLGEAAAAHDLAWQLSAERAYRYSVVGYVTRTTERDNLRDLDHISFKVRRLGLIADLSHIVARNDIDLLVMATDDDRLKVFERATVCAERFRTRLISATAFDEAVFRRVPVEQLNVAWFQHIMHPRFRPVPRVVTRATDIVVAGTIGLLTLPAWALTAAFMRAAFGRPVLVKRRRVGERGRSFSVSYFRVARRDVTGGPPEEDVPPVGFGKFLRASGIERLPLLLSVLRGDMSLVGPRPERPQRMADIEQQLDFYARRNLVRPGLTGWAQLHSLPAAEDAQIDPAIELSHDLFYLKHQSLMLYAYVLMATCWRTFTRPFRGRRDS